MFLTQSQTQLQQSERDSDDEQKIRDALTLLYTLPQALEPSLLEPFPLKRLGFHLKPAVTGLAHWTRRVYCQGSQPSAAAVRYPRLAGNLLNELATFGAEWNYCMVGGPLGSVGPNGTITAGRAVRRLQGRGRLGGRPPSGILQGRAAWDHCKVGAVWNYCKVGPPGIIRLELLRGRGVDVSMSCVLFFNRRTQLFNRRKDEPDNRRNQLSSQDAAADCSPATSAQEFCQLSQAQFAKKYTRADAEAVYAPSQ